MDRQFIFVYSNDSFLIFFVTLMEETIDVKPYYIINRLIIKKVSHMSSIKANKAINTDPKKLRCASLFGSGCGWRYGVKDPAWVNPPKMCS